MKKIESFKSFSQLQNQLREEARLKEVATKREASTAAFNELLSKYNASSINDINEEDIDAFMTELTAEGNAFGAARAEAIAKGEKEFEVEGETYPVEDVDAEDEDNAEEFANESVVNEALGAKSQKAAVRGLAAINKFMAAHPAFAGGKTVADQTIAWLMREALKAAMIDANFGEEGKKAARAINFANFIAPTIFVKEMGGMPIQISKARMMDKVYELAAEIARGVKYDGYAIIEAVALYMESRFKKNSSAANLRDILNKFVGEAKEAGNFEERINEGSAFNSARLKAIADGKDEFEFDGKKYPVTNVDKEDEELADEITEGAFQAISDAEVLMSMAAALAGMTTLYNADRIADILKKGGKKAADLIKKIGKDADVVAESDEITERLDKSTMKRMSGLTDTRDLRDFRSAFLSIVQAHIEEGFEFDEVIEFMNSIMRDPNVRAQLEESLVAEGRAFAAAAKEAKDAGEEEFEFDGKTYPVTIKESEEVNENYEKRKLKDAEEFIKKAEGKEVKLTIFEGGSESEVIGKFKKGSYGLHKIDYMGFDFEEELKSIEEGEGMIMGVRPGQFFKWSIGGKYGTTWLIEVL